MASQDNTNLIRNMMVEINTLNSKMQVVAQRMKTIEKNESIIGLTLVRHNKMLKELESGVGAGGSGIERETPDVSNLTEIEGMLTKLKDQVDSMQKQVDTLNEEMKEAKYILETINPVAYVTVDDVEEIVDQKLKERRK